jgi:prolyl-tRNA editing enzyme YbaK/EbsC (Cys-tRNA(Pro) deacylase)
MPISKKLTKLLEEKKIKYEPIEHRTVYTAYDKAATLKIPEKIVGKTLTVKLDKNYGLVLIPANKNLDKAKFKKIAKVKSVDFAKEVWIKKNLKGVKVGAVPPLGNLWKLPTFIDRFLMNQSKIIINGGDYNWSIKINSAVLKKIIPDLITGGLTKPR